MNFSLKTLMGFGLLSYLGWTNKDSLVSLAKKLFPSTAVEKPAISYVSDIGYHAQAIEELKLFFKKRNCIDGWKSAVQCGKYLFDESVDEPVNTSAYQTAGENKPLVLKGHPNIKAKYDEVSGSIQLIVDGKELPTQYIPDFIKDSTL